MAVSNVVAVLVQRSFVADVAALFSGRAGAAVVAIVLAPVVARLFAPADFGVAAYVVSAITVLSAAATLCYDQALLLPNSHIEARRLAYVALTALACVVVLLLAGASLAVLADMGGVALERLGPWVWLVPFGVLALGLVMVGESWLIRNRRFRLVARADISQAVGTPVSRIALGTVFGSSVWALLVGYMAGLAMKLGALWTGRHGSGNVDMESSAPAAGAATLAVAYREFPLLNAPAKVIRSLSDHLPVLLFAVMFSPPIAGFYAMASRLVGVPAEAVASSVRRVYLQRAAERHARGAPLGALLFKTTASMAAIGTFPFLLLAVVGEPVCKMLLGEDWATAGRYAEILALWFFFVWITTPSSALFVVLRRQGIWLGSQIALGAARFVALYGAFFAGAGPEVALRSFVLVSIGINSVLIGLAVLLVWRAGAVAEAGER